MKQYQMMTFPQHIKHNLLAFVLLMVLLSCSCSLADRSHTYVPLSRSAKVLMVGDSLTVGPFGDHIEAWLIRNLGADRVVVYGACGSSPEHWLASQKDFVSHCGYRETTTQRHILDDYQHVRRPRPVSTPKIEILLEKYRPQVAIIQLGTNHYDSLLHDGKSALPKLAETYENFARALHHPGGSLRMVIWIAPPDASKFPNWVKDEIDNLILRTDYKHGFVTFLSRRHTHYTVGKTGSDGVHYNDAAATLWSDQVIRMLDYYFTRYNFKR